MPWGGRKLEGCVMETPEAVDSGRWRHKMGSGRGVTGHPDSGGPAGQRCGSEPGQLLDLPLTSRSAALARPGKTIGGLLPSLGFPGPAGFGSPPVWGTVVGVFGNGVGFAMLVRLELPDVGVGMLFKESVGQSTTSRKILRKG